MSDAYWSQMDSYYQTGKTGYEAQQAAAAKSGDQGGEFAAGGAAAAFATGAAAGASTPAGFAGGLIGGMAGLLGYAATHPGVGVLGETQAPGAVVDPTDPALLWKTPAAATLNANPLQLRAALGPVVAGRRAIDSGAGGVGLYVQATGAFKAGGAQCTVRILPIADADAYGAMLVNWLSQAGIAPEDWPQTDSIYLALVQTPRPRFATGTTELVTIRDVENISGRSPVVIWAWADTAAGINAEPEGALAAQYPVEPYAGGAIPPGGGSSGSKAGAGLAIGGGAAVLGGIVLLSKL